jgi:hypothetical protein
MKVHVKIALNSCFKGSRHHKRESEGHKERREAARLAFNKKYPLR